MKAEFEVEEARELMVFIVERLMQEAGLERADRQTLVDWRAKMTPGSEGMRELLEKVNVDLARTMERSKKSAVVKPDWR